jgi:hypothetical protein
VALNRFDSSTVSNGVPDVRHGANTRVVVGPPRARLVEPVELGRDAVGERHAARPAAALGRVHLARARTLRHPRAAAGPVDVAPAQVEQLALA